MSQSRGQGRRRGVNLSTYACVQSADPILWRCGWVDALGLWVGMLDRTGSIGTDARRRGAVYGVV
jgi:hypothetical protein